MELGKGADTRHVPPKKIFSDSTPPWHSSPRTDRHPPEQDEDGRSQERRRRVPSEGGDASAT